MSPEDAAISLDTALQIVADTRRRLLLCYLRDASEDAVSADKLVEHICTESTPARDPVQVRIRLHHEYLPQFEKAGLIEYDPRQRTVRYRPDELVETLLCKLEKLDT